MRVSEHYSALIISLTVTQENIVAIEIYIYSTPTPKLPTEMVLAYQIIFNLENKGRLKPCLLVTINFWGGGVSRVLMYNG